MAVPDLATLHTLQAEMNNLGFATGTQAVEDSAWSTAWESAEEFVSTNLLTGTISAERHVWPAGWTDYGENFWRMVQLKKTHLTTVTTATIVHDIGSCDCDTDDVTGCVVYYSKERSQVEIRASSASLSAGCGCLLCNKPAYVDFDYVAGLWACVEDLPDKVKLALAVLAKEFKELMETDGASASAAFVDQWSSMDYSEKRGFAAKTSLGASPQANMAARLLKGYRIRRMPALRGRPWSSAS